MLVELAGAFEERRQLPCETAVEGPCGAQPADHRLASKVTLWKGDIWKLQNIGAMVNSTNETLSDKSGLCKFILEAGGPDLKSACEGSEGCRTGEAIATDPGSLMCRCVSSLPAPASCALD